MEPSKKSRNQDFISGKFMVTGMLIRFLVCHLILPAIFITHRLELQLFAFKPYAFQTNIL